MPRVIQDLNGSDWLFQSFEDRKGYDEIFGSPDYDFSDWMKATVPGNVRLDLIQNGKIEDPFYGKNNKESQWVQKLEWWYKKEFELSKGKARANKVIHLACKAVDYRAEFWLNGTRLGDHEGMFGKIVFDITELAQDRNILLIRLAALKNYPNRFKVASKCQMQYGWDWAPKMVTSGIWDDIFIEIKEKIYIDSCFIRSTLEKKDLALVKITLDVVNQSEADSILITTKIQGKNFSSKPTIIKEEKRLDSGTNQIIWEIKIENPALWYPWDRGKPNLYECVVELTQNDASIDKFQDTFGIRKFELLSQNIDPEYYPWIFQINGEKEYIRGTNWVPPDMLFGQIDRARYEQNIKLAKEANINLFRLWGGGLKEKDDFYKICDEEGMLVWQEFAIACAFLTPLPKKEKFLQTWKAESASIVKALRNHPSLVLWCGGNEVNPRDNAHVIDILQAAVEEYDDRPFFPASPDGGDSHNYEVFHGLGPYWLYLEDEHPFASEFGLSSFPNYTTLQKYVPEEELYFWSSTINYRAPYMVFFQGHKKGIQRYAIPFAPSDDLESIVHATQQAQGLGLKTAIEHFRRRKLNWQNAGCGFWQFNSPWPCCSWCIVEYDFSKKLSFEYVRIAFQPILVNLNYDLKVNFNKQDKEGNLLHRKFEAELFLINDLTEAFPHSKLQITFLTQKNEQVGQIEREIDIPENTCVELDPLTYEFPADLNEPPRIQIKLLSNNKILSKNFYNLGYHDPIQSRTMPKLSKKMSDILFFDKSSRVKRLLKNGYYLSRLIPLYAYLFLKIKIKWRRRKKDGFEYVDLNFLKEKE
ncbi:MAG: hypothetical protein HWN65_15885 [Candidatus Helarchaeota archaeon]|nr:hypothetical protein [Candidatus Helarchaeota archaeon]